VPVSIPPRPLTAAEHARLDADPPWRRIQGWTSFTPIYDAAVAEASDGDRFVEIGTYLGRSTAYMADAIRKSGRRIDFVACDIFSPAHYAAGDYTGQPVATLETVRQNLGLLCERYVHVEQIASVELARRYPNESVALCFIDADHCYAAVMADITAWWPKIAPLGVLAGHDFSHEGVRRAVMEAFGLWDPSELDPQSWRVRKRHDGNGIL
jgi:hypothetical protein